MNKIYAVSFGWKFLTSMLIPLSVHAPNLEKQVLDSSQDKIKIEYFVDYNLVKEDYFVAKNDNFALGKDYLFENYFLDK